MNPNEYLRQRRLSYAADLLQQNKYTISDICLARRVQLALILLVVLQETVQCPAKGL